MYEAICAQPDLVARVLNNRRRPIEQTAAALAGSKRILFAGIGTSWHAALVGERFLRHTTGGRAHALVFDSFELVVDPVAFSTDDALIAISHRGGKNCTVEAARLARAAGAVTAAVTGENGSPGLREAADFLIPTCEQELSSAHTKSYTTALAALALLAICIAEQRDQVADRGTRDALARVPALMRQALSCEVQIRQAARAVAERQRLIFVGTGTNWVTAPEGALKVKETSYLAADGFQTEQFLHGPITELDARAAVVALLAGGRGDVRTIELLRAVGELGALRVVVASRGTATEIPAEHILDIPRVEAWLAPLVHIVPVQLLSYFLALERGTNPDNERKEDAAHLRALQHYRL